MRVGGEWIIDVIVWVFGFFFFGGLILKDKVLFEIINLYFEIMKYIY